MAEDTKIQWANHTFNPWIGCTKVATGCTHCYAESFAKQYNKAAWGPHGTRVKTSENSWRQPLKWNRKAEKAGERRRVFCASVADVFEDWRGTVYDSSRLPLFYNSSGVHKDKAPAGVACTVEHLRRDLFALIDETPHLDWLLLTKRPENVESMWPCTSSRSASPQTLKHRDNVWLGCSVSDQATADCYVPELLKCRDLAPVLFLSCEPLLGPINLDAWLEYRPGIDWVIVGGESGQKARPCEMRWICDLAKQCRASGVPCFVKQLGSRPLRHLDEMHVKQIKLTDCKGGDPAEWPAEVPVLREFPLVTKERVA